jgi:hypothetical protein
VFRDPGQPVILQVVNGTVEPTDRQPGSFAQILGAISALGRDGIQDDPHVLLGVEGQAFLEMVEDDVGGRQPFERLSCASRRGIDEASRLQAFTQRNGLRPIDKAA